LNFIHLFFQKDDPVVDKLFDSSEEGKKVTRNNGEKYPAIFRRIQDPLLAETNFIGVTS
jgi:tRNA (guanine-N7-)-methyltransferase